MYIGYIISKPDVLRLVQGSTHNAAFNLVRPFATVERWSRRLLINKSQKLQRTSSTDMITQSPLNKLSVSNRAESFQPKIPIVNSVILKRGFHSSIPRKFINPPNFDKGPPRIKVFRISPLLFILSGIGFFVVLFTILPFIFTTFFPLLILGIIIHQFNKWKRNVVFSQLSKALTASKMRTRVSVMRSLQVANMEKAMGESGTQNELFKTIFKDINSSFTSSSGTSNLVSIHQEAKRLKEFTKNRVLEAIKNDEDGIRTFFLGNDVNKWLKQNYDLIIDTNEQSSFLRSYEQNLMIQVTFPLYLKSSQNPRKHIGNVVVTAMPNIKSNSQRIGDFSMFGNVRDLDQQCYLVIAVQPVGYFTTRQFIITKPGKSGELQAKYDISKTTDGHVEYTIRDKGGL